MASIGIIGAGVMASYHGGMLAKEPDARVVAVAASRPERAQALAAKLGAEAEADARRLVERPDVDAVLVATPTPYHREYVEVAAAAGKAIFCEKPIARTLEDAQAMLEAVDRAGVRLQVGHVVRWFPEYELARQMSQQGALGQVGTARATRVNAYPYGSNGWYSHFDQSGGVLLDMGIHDLDWLLWTFGPAHRVFARTVEAPGQSAAMVSLRHESGVISYAEGSWCHPGFATTLEVAGSDGVLMTDSDSTKPLRIQPRERTGERAAVEVPVTVSRQRGPYEQQDHDWLRWISGGPPPRCTAHDALESLRLALAALESARTGRAVILERGAP